MKDYKKILEGVMNIINTTENSDIGFVNICDYISENCPELTESEDEKIRKETWWRRYYKRITLDEKAISRGKCLSCDASIHKGGFPGCSWLRDRDCPCKINQCLKKIVK